MSNRQLDPEGEIEILLVPGPIHYDFLLPLNPQTRDQFARLARYGQSLNHPGARWLLIGWGASEFYTTTGDYGDVGARAVLRGIFGDSSVMRTDILGRLNPEVDARRIRMNSTQYKSLLQAIDQSFGRHDNAPLPPLDVDGFTETDVFFPAAGQFNLFRTCNTWVGRMLRKAGLPFGAWVPLPYSVTLSHRMFLQTEN